MSWFIVYGKFVGKYSICSGGFLSTFLFFRKHHHNNNNNNNNNKSTKNVCFSEHGGKLCFKVKVQVPRFEPITAPQVIRILDLPDPKRDFGSLALPKLSTRATSQKRYPSPRNRKALWSGLVTSNWFPFNKDGLLNMSISWTGDAGGTDHFRWMLFTQQLSRGHLQKIV